LISNENKIKDAINQNNATCPWNHNSPLENGDKGGCEASLKVKEKKQPPPPPLLRGNFPAGPRLFPCPAVLMGKDEPLR
jgi:hypothetical protein